MNPIFDKLSNTLKACFSCGLAIALFFVGSPQLPAHAAYSDIISTFDGLNDSTTYPVVGASFDNIRSTFAPRILSSSGNYDFHRGLDIEGAVNDNVVAPIAGKFEKYRSYNSCGNTVILRHDLDTPITYQGKTVDRYYTWYCHLSDATDSIVANWSKGDPIAQGTHIGELGQSGSATYPHLHFEIRVGTNNSLQYQIANYSPISSKYFGFDPHMHPMLLFEPYTYSSSGANTYTQTLTTLTSTPTAGSDVEVEYESTNDDMPLLNRIEVAIGTSVSHTLDFNQRTGFDARSTRALDCQGRSVGNVCQAPTAPYFSPDPWSSSATNYTTNLVIPGSWTSGYAGEPMKVTAYDLWGNIETVTIPLS